MTQFAWFACQGERIHRYDLAAGLFARHAAYTQDEKARSRCRDSLDVYDCSLDCLRPLLPVPRSFSRSNSNVSWLLDLANGTEGVGLGTVGIIRDAVEEFLGMDDVVPMALVGSSSGKKTPVAWRAPTFGSSVIFESWPLAAMLDVEAVALESRPYDEARPRLDCLGRCCSVCEAVLVCFTPPRDVDLR